MRPPRHAGAIILGLALLAVVVAGFTLLAPADDSQDVGVPVVPRVECDPAGGPCVAEVAGLIVSLALGPPIRPLQPMPVSLQVTGGNIQEPQIAFTMIGMDMGPSRYRLQAAGQGRWAAEAILPVCGAGRRDWLASIDYAVDGRRHAVAFSFSSDR